MVFIQCSWESFLSSFRPLLSSHRGQDWGDLIVSGRAWDTRVCLWFLGLSFIFLLGDLELLWCMTLSGDFHDCILNFSHTMIESFRTNISIWLTLLFSFRFCLVLVSKHVSTLSWWLWQGLRKYLLNFEFKLILSWFRSRGGSTKGKESEYENLESDVADDEEQVPLNISRDSEQREIDEFEEEEKRLLAEEEKVKFM